VVGKGGKSRDGSKKENDVDQKEGKKGTVKLREPANRTNAVELSIPRRAKRWEKGGGQKEEMKEQTALRRRNSKRKKWRRDTA